MEVMEVMEPASRELEMDRPPKLRELLLDIGKCHGKCRSPVRTRSSLGENPFSLQLQGLPLTFSFGGLDIIVCGDRFWSGSLILLFFHGFTLPSSRHTFHSTPRLTNK